jgi:hypothetical protein
MEFSADTPYFEKREIAQTLDRIIYGRANHDPGIPLQGDGTEQKIRRGPSAPV